MNTRLYGVMIIKTNKKTGSLISTGIITSLNLKEVIDKAWINYKRESSLYADKVDEKTFKSVITISDSIKLDTIAYQISYDFFDKSIDVPDEEDDWNIMSLINSALKGDELCDEELEDLWNMLEDVVLKENKDGKLLLEDEWFIFEEGTDIEDIWHWFDNNHSKGVGWLINEYE